VFAENFMVNDVVKYGDAVRVVEQNEAIDKVAFGSRDEDGGRESEWLEFFWCEKAADTLLEFQR
jgi:hypothetical protein